MRITEVTEQMLPLFLIEALTDKGPVCEKCDSTFKDGVCRLCRALREEWIVFTYEPLASEQDALKHIALILQEYPDKKDRLRIMPYTKERWRQDLIEAVLLDYDAMNRALSILRNETLVNLLKEPEDTHKEFKRINVTGTNPKRVNVTGTPQRRIEPDEFANMIGAEKMSPEEELEFRSKNPIIP